MFNTSIFKKSVYLIFLLQFTTILYALQHLLHLCLKILFVMTTRNSCCELKHLMAFVSNVLIFWEIYEIFGLFKDVKRFAEFQMRSWNRRKIILVFGKFWTMIGTQWQIRYTHHPLRTYAYIFGNTFLWKISFLMYSLHTNEILTISFE